MDVLRGGGQTYREPGGLAMCRMKIQASGIQNGLISLLSDFNGFRRRACPGNW
jgi:hypothetical protein